MNVSFDATIRRNIYTSDNFKIYSCDIDSLKFPNIKLNKYGNVTVSGNIHELIEDTDYNITGEEINDKYGYTYKIKNIKKERPRSLDTVRNFLMEIVTFEQANQLITHYPDIIDRVINNNLDDIDLTKLYNIGESRFSVIKRKILENFALAEMIDEFKGLLDFKIAKALLDKYTTIENIKEKLLLDPYRCLCNISRIAFKTADKILLEFNKDCIETKNKGEVPPIDFTFDLQTSSQRQKSAIMFLLEENENDGNTKIDIKVLRKQSELLAKKCIEHFVDIIKNDKDIHFGKATNTVALEETYQTEVYIANRILEGLKVENKWSIDTEKYKINSEVTLTDQQYKVLPMICNSNVSILNGFSGSGKSQTTKSVIDMLKDNNKSFCLFAPTGRASKVLAEFTKENASTIHRGLAYMPPEWGYNEEHKLPYHVVIVDEFGMTDVFLMKHLLEAIDFRKTKLLMIGDSAQLPSVGAGNVFYDLINSKLIPIVSLIQIFRYGTGGILTIATKTRNSEKFLDDSQKPQIFGEDKGYMFVPMQQEIVIKNVVALYKKLLASGNSIEDIMILSSYNVGDYGTVAINKHLQPIANPNFLSKGIHVQIGDTKFYVNDLVIQSVNNYKAIRYNEEWIDENDKTFVANGEIGKIVKIEYGKVIIMFDELVVYTKNDLLNAKLAYSISTYKSQGGQAKIVIMITPKAHTFMLNSNLIYVAQTRAKQKVFHFGETETVNRAIKKKADFNRKTNLKELLLSS